MNTFRITDKGRTMNLDGEDLRLILVVEVANRLEHFIEENLWDLCEELTQKYGSVENAVVAVKSGLARFAVDEKADDDHEAWFPVDEEASSYGAPKVFQLIDDGAAEQH